MAISQALCTSFKSEILDEQHDITSDTIKCALFTSSASLGAGTTAYSTSNEVANGNGYATGGASVTARTWASVATNKYRFDSTAVTWTATGGTVPNIKYAVVYQAGGKLVCFSKLTTSQFTLAQDNTLTVTPSATGIFELA